MDATNDTPSIINKIIDMDVNDAISVKDVMDVIINHPYRASFLLASLLSTSKHQNAELAKSIFCHHEAWTTDDLYVFIFGKEGGPHFLVNIFERRLRRLRDYMPFERYAKRINGEIVNEVDIYVPPLQYRDIEEFVRIDVFSDESFKIRNFVTSSEVNKANGRFFIVGNIDIDEIVMSLHRCEEGYKIIDQLTNFDVHRQYEDYEDDDDEHDRDIDNDDEEEVPYVNVNGVNVNDTFENKIVNYVYELQKNIRTIGDLSTLVKGMLPGLIVYHSYDENNLIILAIQSPVDGILSILIFDRILKETIREQKLDVKANMRNFLTHYIPDYIYNDNRRMAILLGMTYNISVRPSYESFDTITSLMHSSESSEVKDAVNFYISNITLKDRCRHVILKNKGLLCSQIKEIPQMLQNFIYSSNRSNELINYCMDV